MKSIPNDNTDHAIGCKEPGISSSPNQATGKTEAQSSHSDTIYKGVETVKTNPVPPINTLDFAAGNAGTLSNNRKRNLKGEDTMKDHSIKTFNLISFALGLLIATSAAHAATRNVPSTYPTIQAGINASSNGDTVLVADGSYSGTGNVTLDTLGKAITIKSVNGWQRTYLNGGTTSRLFAITRGEKNSTVINGFLMYQGHADQGGAIEVINSSPSILNCYIETSVVTDNGGGMYVYNGSPVITNTVFDSNFAGSSNRGWGGGLYCWIGNPKITSCTFSNNNSNIWGGGLFLQATSATVSKCIFKYNGSTSGGGLCEAGSHDTIKNCSFTSNGSDGSGGGVSVLGGSSSSYTTDTFNSNYAQNGGAMNIDGSDPDITSCVFSSNAAAFDGGAIEVWYSSTGSDIEKSTFTSNTAKRDGGAINFISSNGIVNKSTFAENRAYTRGGAIDMTDSSPDISNDSFTNNLAAHPQYYNASGGAIGVYTGAPNIDDCAFLSNETDYFGGGLYNVYGSPWVKNSTFVSNKADQYYGGGVMSFGTMYIENCSFTKNIAYNTGGIYLGTLAGHSNYTFIWNTILWSDFNGEFVNNANGLIRYSDIQYGFTGTGNINLDPQFSDTKLHLKPTSPCIGIGTTRYTLPAADKDGKPRVINGLIDMGPYQTNTAHVVVDSTSVSRLNSSIVQVQLHLTNTGVANAYSLNITSLKLKGIFGSEVSAISSLPGKTGGWVTFRVAGVPAGIATLAANGSFTGGTFSYSHTVSVP